METLSANILSNAEMIFNVGKSFTTWAIGDELVALGLTLTAISFVARLVISAFHRA